MPPEAETKVTDAPSLSSRLRQAGTLVNFRKRVIWSDRIATWLISFSGIGIITMVMGIGLFLFLEILPFFRPARIEATQPFSVADHGSRVHLVVSDEYQKKAVVVGEAGEALFADLENKRVDSVVPLEGIDGRRIVSAKRSVENGFAALGTDDGSVWLGRIQFQSQFVDGKREIVPEVALESIIALAPGQPVTAVAFYAEEDAQLIAGLSPGQVTAVRIAVKRPLVGPERREETSFVLPVEGWGEPTGVAVSGDGRYVFIGTDTGTLLRWHVPQDGNAELVEQVTAVADGAVTAIDFLLGGRSLVVGSSTGSVSSWSLVRSESASDGRQLTRIHELTPHAAAVRLIAPSSRDKGFLTISEDGKASLHYMTNERLLGRFELDGGPAAAVFAPKANGVVAVNASGVLHHWDVDNPHPEVSWKALFGKVWYEGYDKPEYIWQSSGGTDDFESKFSLVPLIFGTLKGTFYALLFAIPLALFGALYCSQFLEKRWRAGVKSTVELMAALPSVVLGFIAGVLLAPLVQARIVSVIIAPVVIPVMTVLVLMGMSVFPNGSRLVKRYEFWTIVLGVFAGILVSAALGPLAERVLFGGDFATWLMAATGTRYDQRNAMVVGWTMGFAVVPIIFTICEDAFSAVPKHLTGASLACGASLWQTAWRVVLPAAGSGVFSAVMIGFGRAVGETMIVLMATGNTPVLDWSMFNGFRALSANIAVEIPEAPHGGSLYRVLFIAALLLFTMTSLVNTVAEVIRLRLRKQLAGL